MIQFSNDQTQRLLAALKGLPESHETEETGLLVEALEITLEDGTGFGVYPFHGNFTSKQAGVLTKSSGELAISGTCDYGNVYSAVLKIRAARLIAIEICFGPAVGTQEPEALHELPLELAGPLIARIDSICKENGIGLDKPVGDYILDFCEIW